MGLLAKFNSFRARIVILLIMTLVVTTAMLYELNRRTERVIIDEVKEQQKDLTAAIKIATQSLSSSKYLNDMLKEKRLQAGTPVSHESHIERILVVNQMGIVDDSSDNNDLKKPFEDLGFGTLAQSDDPWANSGDQLTEAAFESAYQIFKFPVETDKGKFNLVIIFSAHDLTQLLQTTSDFRLLATGGVLLISILVSLILVLQFTRPVGKLAEAAKRVASGDFNICLPVTRKDELGRLMAVFNEMVVGLRERRELEARLYRAEQSAIVGRLASGIAHEVKNPLNYISLTIDYLRKFAPESEDTRARFVEKMDSIKEEIKRLDRLIRNFLSYGRPLNLNLKPVALRELIGSILALSSEQAEQQQIKLEMDQKTDIPLIEADSERMKSCFSNLVLNAQQAMANGGELRIEFNPKNEGIEVMVKDTGTGIEPENIEKIFEPYFSTKDTGTGLGLPLVKRIVEGHGGRISVESTPNRGTTFHVWLPAHPPKAVEQPADNFRLDRLESLPAF